MRIFVNLLKTSLGFCICALAAVLASGCFLDDVAEAFGEALGKGLVCGFVATFASSGVSSVGTVDAKYELVDDKDSEPQPLALGTRGKARLFEYGEIRGVAISDPKVLSLGNFHSDEDDCGLVGDLEALAVGETDVVVTNENGETHTWQLSVLEPAEIRISSTDSGELKDGETLTLSTSEGNELVDIEVGLFDFNGRSLAFLEQALWRVVRGSSIVAIGTKETSEESPYEDELTYLNKPVGGEISVEALAVGTATLEVHIETLIQASFPIIVE